MRGASAAVTANPSRGTGGASVPYDLFELNGNAGNTVLDRFALHSPGVAFDGLHFIVSDIVIQQISTYALSGQFLSTTSLSGVSIPFGLEGLSVVAPPVQPPPEQTGTRPQIWLVGPIPGRLSQCLR
jgi:hypothetical protein